MGKQGGYLSQVLWVLVLGSAVPGSALAVDLSQECTISGSTTGYVSCSSDISWPTSAPTNGDYIAVRSNPGSANVAIDVPYDSTNLNLRACRYVDNASATTNSTSYFVPFKTPDEWSAFLNAPHATNNRDHLYINQCARPRAFNIKTDVACISPSPVSYTANLPYAKTDTSGNSDVTYSYAFNCGDGTTETVIATFRPGLSPDGAITPEKSGWSMTVGYTHGSCGAADGIGTATAPTDLCSGSTVLGTGPTLSGSEWQWTCIAQGTSSSAALPCSAPYSLTPKCGPANNVAVPSAPSGAENLCSEGTASIVSGLGPWTWTCDTTTGSSISCEAPTSVVAQCGTANGIAVTTAPTNNLCSGGQASEISGSGPWTWTCTSGATSLPCDAPLKPSCGEANGTAVASKPTDELCATGTATTVSGTGPWTWSCTSGALSASCSANSTAEAACGSTANTVVTSTPTTGLCSAGTASAVTYISNPSPLAQWYYQWTCTKNAKTVTCVAPKCACAMCGPASGVSSATAPSSGLCGYGTLRNPPGVFLNTPTQWKWYCDHAETASAHICYAPKP